MGRNKGLYVFGLLMLLIYWGMAFLLLGSSLFVEQLTPASGMGWELSSSDTAVSGHTGS